MRIPYVKPKLIAIIVSFPLILLACFSANRIPISSLVPSSTPRIALDLKFLGDPESQVTAAERSSNEIRDEGNGEQTPTAAPQVGSLSPSPLPVDPKCTELTAGEGSSTNRLSPYLLRQLSQRPTSCPLTATWKSEHHPFAISIYLRNGDRAKYWYQNSKEASNFFSSDIFRGTTEPIARAIGVRGEDLRLKGIKGAIIPHLLKEIIYASPALHVDRTRGKEGFVLNFKRDKAPAVGRLLPILLPKLARTGFNVASLPQPIFSLHLVGRELFITEFEDQIVLSTGLDAMLDILSKRISVRENDQSANVADLVSTSGQSIKGAFSESDLLITFRAEAYMKGVLKTLTHKDQFSTQLGFKFTPTAIIPTGGISSEGYLLSRIRQKFSPALLTTIPRDAFAGMAISATVPVHNTEAEWKTTLLGDAKQISSEKPVTVEPTETGVALIWEINAQEKKVQSYGIAIVVPKNFTDRGKLTSIFNDSPGIKECAGGAIYLAASTEKLLNRMYESCERRSTSILDLKNNPLQNTMNDSPFFAFANLKILGTELLHLGLPKEGNEDLGLKDPNNPTDPTWQKEYEAARAAAVKKGETDLSRLPILAYVGNVSNTKLYLNGFLTQIEGK